MINEVESVATDFSVTYQPSQITINNLPELKEKVNGYAKKYDGLVATDESLKGAKSAKAELNKLIKAIDDKRKSVKRDYDEPYNDFKKDVDELQAILKETVEPIKESISKIENQQRDERKSKVEELIFNMAPAYGVDPNDIAIEDSWTNKTMTEAKLTKILKDGFTALKHKQDSFKASKQLIEEHCKLKGVDSAGWINQLDEDTDVSQLIASVDKPVIDKKNAEQAEQNRKEYEEAISKSKQSQVDDKTIDKDTGEIVSDEEAIDDDAPDEYTVTFAAFGDLIKLQKLSDFLDDNDIRYETVEEVKEVGM